MLMTLQKTQKPTKRAACQPATTGSSPSTTLCSENGTIVVAVTIFGKKVVIPEA